MDRWPPHGGVHGTARPVGQFVRPFGHVDGDHSRDAWAVCGPVLLNLVTTTAPFRDTPADRRSSLPHLRVSDPRSRGVPRESLDTPEDLPKEGPGQVTLGKLEHGVFLSPFKAKMRAHRSSVLLLPPP